MKIYTCAKPCTIGGQHFIIGETVPGELIAPEREKALTKYGILAVSEPVQPPVDPGKAETSPKNLGKPAVAPAAKSSAPAASKSAKPALGKKPAAPAKVVETTKEPEKPTEPPKAPDAPATPDTTPDAGDEHAAKPGRKVQ